MTALEPITGVIVARPPKSVREVDSRDWDEDEAWKSAVDFWLTSVRSQHSKAAYKRDIDRWHDWCRDGGVPLDDARRANVDTWRDDLVTEGLSPATIARRMSAVSSFYRYWSAEDVVSRNPAENAARPSVSPDPVSISLTRREAADLLAYVDSLADKRPGVIVRLLAETGMRVGELTAAQASDLGQSGGHHTLAVTRKGGKRKLFGIAPTTHERVMAYLDGRTEGYLLHVQRTERRTKGDGQMDRSYVRQLLRRLAKEAGLPMDVWQKMHPHVLRHSAATMLAADNVPVHRIQELLGHADLRTTQRYIHHQEGLDGSLTYRLAGLLAR